MKNNTLENMKRNHVATNSEILYLLHIISSRILSLSICYWSKCLG